MLKKLSSFLLILLFLTQNSWALLSAEQHAEYRNLLNTKDPDKIYQVVKKIETEMPEAPIIENSLIKFLGMQSLDFRPYIAEILARYHHHAGKRFLVNLIQDQKTPLDQKLRALGFFGEIHSKEGLQALQASLDSPNTYVQITGLENLLKYGKFPGQKEVESLYLSLKDEEKALLLRALAKGNRDHYLDFFQKVTLGNNRRLSRIAFDILLKEPTEKAKYTIEKMAPQLTDRDQIIESTLYLHEFLGNKLDPIKDIYLPVSLQGRAKIIDFIHSKNEKYAVSVSSIINILLKIETDPYLIDKLNKPSPKQKTYDELRAEMEARRQKLYQEHLKKLS